MRIDYNAFLGHSQTERQRYVNFFNAFGYLVLADALSWQMARSCQKEYKRLYESHYQDSWRHILASGQQFFVPNFYENSIFFLDEVLAKVIHPAAKVLSQGSCIYLGSDGSCFNGSSFEWHRDWYTQTRMLKFNLYLNHHRHIGGRHLLIPGSQFPTDEYSQAIGRGGAWPFRPKQPGWLNENSYFPQTPCPRDHPLKRIYRKSKGVNYLPYVALRPRPVDLILFDQRTWHLVEKPFPAIPQLLATALFAVHPGKDVCLSKAETKIDQQQVATRLEELACLYAAERMMIGCPNYGQYFDRISHDILHFRANRDIASHRMDSSLMVELSDHTFAVNVREKLDYFAKRGKAVRKAMTEYQDGYTTEMLGLNSSNQYYRR